VLNADGSIAHGSSYNVQLGPKWSRATVITGQGTKITHCNDLLFGALLSVHHCISLNPNSFGEIDGLDYGYASNWSLKHGNSCGCASKMNTFVADPQGTPTISRLPFLVAVQSGYNPYSETYGDCAASTDPVELADMALTQQLIDTNRKLNQRLWKHRGCTFELGGRVHDCIRRSKYQGYSGPTIGNIGTVRIMCHGITRLTSHSLLDFSLVPREYENRYQDNPYYSRSVRATE